MILSTVTKPLYDNAEKIFGVAFGIASGTATADELNLMEEGELLLAKVITAAIVTLVSGILGAVGAHFGKKIIKKFGW